jgi:NitT/TauT family transport system substrate-binding protein
MAALLAACSGASPTPAPTAAPPTAAPPTVAPATAAPATQAPATAAPTEAPTAEPTPADLGTIRVGLIPIAAMTPLDRAVKDGLYAQRGLTVELVDIGFADSIPVLESGDIDMVLEIPGPALRAVQAGADIVAVYQNEIAHAAPPDTGGLVAAGDSGINTLTDLRGKTIAVNALHSQEVVSAQHVLREAGVNPDEYEFIEIPFPDMPDAVANGQVDAAVMVDPFTTIAQKNGGKVLSWMYVEAVPEQPLGVFWAKSDWAAEHVDALTAFGEATTQAQDALKADEAAARVSVAEYSGLEPDLVASMPLIAWEGAVNLDNWQALVDMLVSEEELEPGIVVTDHLADNLRP